MHICLVFGGIEDGGMEQHVSELARGLSTRHQVSVIAHQVHQDKFFSNVDFFPFDLSRWRFSPILKRDIHTLLKEIRPDVIHAHGRKAGVVIGPLKKKLKTPKILSLHNPANASRIAKSFDTVIGVSSTVVADLKHKNAIVILNGRG